ncbi:hypothetical protein E4T56_gene20904 [Termitomyces sp. T112]|nr:hypothetical protein E4T56_gene20904 [Termitomyces sp. T112]
MTSTFQREAVAGDQGDAALEGAFVLMGLGHGGDLGKAAGARGGQQQLAQVVLASGADAQRAERHRAASAGDDAGDDRPAGDEGGQRRRDQREQQIGPCGQPFAIGAGGPDHAERTQSAGKRTK